jgi:transcription elongation GreA/GreB family factor
MARGALTDEGGERLREIFEAADGEEATDLKQRLQECSGLSGTGRGQLLGLLRAVHPDLFVEDRKPWEEEVIWTTDTGLKRRQVALDHILQEDIPAVAKQIGEAAAFGDLSENAEFTAALEKRDQLTSRATRMEEELQRARVIEPEMAASAFVNIGTRVRARALDSGEEETYTFLGPWDTDVEARILNYAAPLALAFMGKKPGQEVVYGEEGQERRWEVLAVEPAL